MAEYVDYFKAFDCKIRRKKTGSLAELAEAHDLSISTVKNIIRSMREKLNAPIQFSRIYNSYIYTREGTLDLGWKDCKKDAILDQIRKTLDKEL